MKISRVHNTGGGYGWRTPFLPSRVSLSRINSAQSGMETWLYNWIAFTGQIYACPRHCFRTGIDFSRDCVPTDGKKEEEKKKEETRQFFVFLFVRFRYANDQFRKSSFILYPTYPICFSIFQPRFYLFYWVSRYI